MLQNMQNLEGCGYEFRAWDQGPSVEAERLEGGASRGVQNFG